MKMKKISAVLTAAAAALSMLATPASAVFYDSYNDNGTVYYDNYNGNSNGTVYYDSYNGNYYDSNGVNYYSNGTDGYFYNNNSHASNSVSNGTVYYYNNDGKYYDAYGNLITYDSYGNPIVTKKASTANTKTAGYSTKKTTASTKSKSYYYAARSVLGDFPYVKHSYVYQRTASNSRKKIDQYKFSDGYGNTITVRRASGNRDVSGNTTTYSRSTKAKIGNSYVKIKGSKSGYYLAIWTRNGYAYSVKSSYAMSLDDIEDVVIDVMNGYVY